MTGQSPQSQYDPGRLRKIAIATYACAAAISVAWGLSADISARFLLGGEMRIGAVGDGSTYLVLHNASHREWTNVRVELDEQWFYRLERLRAGERVDVRLREFESVHRIPRPAGVFQWEALSAQQQPGFADATHQPSNARVVTDQGRQSAPLSR